MFSMVFTWVATIVALVGTILNCKQLRACFYLWTVTNAMWFAWDLYSGLLSRCVLDAVQFALAVWGIYEWKRIEQKREQPSLSASTADEVVLEYE